MGDQIIQRARSSFWKGDYRLAHGLYEGSLDLYPEMWWLEMEKIRTSHPNRFRNRLSYFKFVYSPGYKANNYQQILYSACAQNKVNFQAMNAQDMSKLFDEFLENPMKVVFHQHWLREIYRGKNSNQADIKSIHSYFNRLQCFRCLGGKVIWSVHNFWDHDLSDSEFELNKICLDRMCSCSDIILLHTPDMVSELEDITQKKIAEKVKIMKHPLYNSMVKINTSIPPEINGCDLSNKFVFLFFGMIRPYKGGEKLCYSFLEQIKNNNLHNSLLIIAGKIYDEYLKNFLNENLNTYKDKIIVINRRISDQELSHLCSNADVAVLPYQKILTSGSYYQATTFALPSIVPDIGMFKTEVVDGYTGIKYFHPEELGKALLKAYLMGSKGLKAMGEQALAACSGQDEESFSQKFYDLINSLLIGEL